MFYGSSVHLWICLVYTVFVCGTVRSPNGKKSMSDLSDIPHEIDGTHNAKYDQEALFGEEAAYLDDMTPEEGLAHLRILFKKMDTDGDSYITPSEMKTWLQKVHDRIDRRAASQMWEEHGLLPTQTLSWESYVRHVTGENGVYHDAIDENNHKDIERDKRRWEVADSDHDGFLTQSEAVAFIYAESDPRMRSVLAMETLDDLDKNKNGFIDLEEYIADMWVGDKESEPEWVQNERSGFTKFDTNQDGKLDLAEIETWLFNSNIDFADSEVQHLFSECDADKDTQLTLPEVEDRYDLFISSAATNYGETLTDHDEL